MLPRNNSSLKFHFHIYTSRIKAVKEFISRIDRAHKKQKKRKLANYDFAHEKPPTSISLTRTRSYPKTGRARQWYYDVREPLTGFAHDGGGKKQRMRLKNAPEERVYDSYFILFFSRLIGNKDTCMRAHKRLENWITPRRCAAFRAPGKDASGHLLVFLGKSLPCARERAHGAPTRAPVYLRYDLGDLFIQLFLSLFLYLLDRSALV